jgi:hypothetical protein
MTEKLTVGQEVRVFDVNARRRGQPHGGWAGTITRVGRTLVYIDYPGSREPKAFRIDGGAANDQYGHQSFLTLDEAARQARRTAALGVLHEHGLRLDYGHSLPLEEIEAIAAILRPDQTSESE